MALSEKAEAAFLDAKKRSDDGIADMRIKAAKVLGTEPSVIIGVNGSYARREVTNGSDVDLFVLYKGQHKQNALTLPAAVPRSLGRQRLQDAGNRRRFL